MAPVAKFAAHRAELMVIERPAEPVYEGGRVVRTNPAKIHRFENHQCEVTGQASIDFMRMRMRAPDGPEVYELDASDIPAVNDLLRELATADIPRVRDILKAELDGPQREDVLVTARAVIEKAGVSERAPGRPTAKTRHELVAD